MNDVEDLKTKKVELLRLSQRYVKLQAQKLYFQKLLEESKTKSRESGDVTHIVDSTEPISLVDQFIAESYAAHKKLVQQQEKNRRLLELINKEKAALGPNAEESLTRVKFLKEQLVEYAAHHEQYRNKFPDSFAVIPPREFEDEYREKLTIYEQEKIKHKELKKQQKQAKKVEDSNIEDRTVTVKLPQQMRLEKSNARGRELLDDENNTNSKMMLEDSLCLNKEEDNNLKILGLEMVTYSKDTEMFSVEFSHPLPEMEKEFKKLTMSFKLSEERQKDGTMFAKLAIVKFNVPDISTCPTVVQLIESSRLPELILAAGNAYRNCLELIVERSALEADYITTKWSRVNHVFYGSFGGDSKWELQVDMVKYPSPGSILIADLIGFPASFEDLHPPKSVTTLTDWVHYLQSVYEELKD